MIEALEHVLWPLVVLLVLLVGLHRARETVEPLVCGIIQGLAKHAQVNAPAYGLAIMFGLSASLSAFWDVFHALSREQLVGLSWHAYLALWTKVLNPFIVATLAYATQSRFKQANP